MAHFKRFFLWYTVGTLTVLLLAASFFRFMVVYDYEVVYEGYCDPYVSECFEYCEDGECTEPIHYTLIYRQAHELRSVCGDLDVLSCEEASMCTAEEVECMIEYCDTNTSDNECEFLDITDAGL